MSLAGSDLVARFPEFAPAYTAYPDMVNGAVSDAEGMVDRVYWGNKADQGVLYFAAHLVATNPLGEIARLKGSTDGSTVYLTHFNRLLHSLGAGFRVI